MRKLNGYGLLIPALILPLAMAAPTAAPAQDLICEPERLAEKYPGLEGRTIRLGQDGESPPFSFRSPDNFEEIIGLDADTAREVFACAGLPVEFVIGSWSGLIPAVIAGQIDVMWDTLLYTPERAREIDFVYYMNSATAVVVAAGNPYTIESLDDLCGLRASAGLGTTQEAMLRETSEACVAEGNEAIEIITSSDIPSGMRLIQNDRADAQATNAFLAGIMAQSNPAVEVAFGITTNARIAAGVTKGQSDLVQVIFDGLTILQNNGVLEEIFERYDVDYDLVVAPQILTE